MQSARPLRLTPRTTEDPELADRFNRVLADTVEAMEESGLKYAFIGGVASGGLGRPRSTHDIDLFVRPEDAELTLRALGRKGFRVERTDPNWLYKGFKEDILVDVIFKSKGEIYLDSEMAQRMITAEFHGKKIRIVSPEDLLIIKAAAHSELTPSHWHDAIALLAHANLDWDYLVHRARRAPRRILSLLLYAQSNDIWVPNRVITELYQVLFGETVHPRISILSAKEEKVRQEVPPLAGKPAEKKRCERAYAAAHLHEILAQDPRTNELDIEVKQDGDKILLRGEVATHTRKEAVGRITRERFPGFVIENQIRVTPLEEPDEQFSREEPK